MASSPEEELKDELTKLEITTSSSSNAQVKQLLLDGNQLPILLNPFYDVAIKNDEIPNKLVTPNNTPNNSIPAENQQQQQQPNHESLVNCKRCRQRRLSESVLDDYRAAKVNEGDGLAVGSWRGSSSNGSTLSNRSAMPRLQRLSFKRTTPSGAGTGGGSSRRLIIREPVLRALQSCLQPQNGTRRRILIGSDDGDGVTRNILKLNNECDAVTSSNAISDNFPSTSRGRTSSGITDFHDLIEECRTLLQHDVTFCQRLNHPQSSSLSDQLRKSFTTMRSNREVVGGVTGKYRTTSLSEEIVRDNGNGCTSRKSPSSSSSMFLSSHNSLAAVAAMAAVSRSNNNTSCSQQAGNGSINVVANGTSTTAAIHSSNNAAIAVAGSGVGVGNVVAGGNGVSCDDVTIDELASYFDTFVHIPKKMSTMAEMMYT